MPGTGLIIQKIAFICRLGRNKILPVSAGDLINFEIAARIVADRQIKVLPIFPEKAHIPAN